MVLILKQGESKEVRELKLISVLNVSVKILSKVLANHFRNVLGKFIDNYQSGFLKGRSILDSIAFAQKAIQFFKRNKIPGFSC